MDDVVTDVPHSQDDIERAAAEWVVRLGGAPLSPSEGHALETWLGTDDRHRAAFERARRAWSELDGLREQPGALRKVVSSSDSAPKPRRKTTTVLMLLGAGGVATAYMVGDPWIAMMADHSTGPGGTKVVSLTDGSTIELDATSAIAVKFDAKERRVILLRGAVYVAATPRETAGDRPFVLEAANGRTTALGTKFAVEDVGDGASVEAVEHKVEVSLDDASGETVVLSPGEGVRYGAEGVGSVSRVDPDAVAPWRTGALVFRNAPLAEVVETLNRHRRERIVVVGAELSARRVSGVFSKDDLADAASVIATELNARTATAPGLVTILY